MQYKNDKNISLAVAVFLATDNYDHEEGVISATSLMKPTRMLVLEGRLPPSDNIADVSGLVASRMGTAIHDAIEKSWRNPVKTLKNLGHPKRVYENILINPKPEEVTDLSIPIYMEQRAYKEVLGYKVSGKFDFVGEGMVQDFKSTSVWSYINQNSIDSYITQMSIYRWLNPEIITKPVGMIHYFFTDWSAMQARSKNYPPDRVHSQKLKLMGLEATESYVTGKVKHFIDNLNVAEDKLPLCSDKELWRKATAYKYYKDPMKTGRSTKNFDTKHDAMVRLGEDNNVGLVKEVPGTVVRCKYCTAFPVCTQKDSLIEKGELIL